MKKNLEKKCNLFFIFSILLFLTSVFYFTESISKFSGKAIKSSGFINVTIDPTILINFTVSNINWGSGFVEEDFVTAMIDTTGNIINGTWDPVSSGFVIKNIGNTIVEMDFVSLRSANTFIGGTGSSYKYKISNVNPNACIPPDEIGDTFIEFPAAGTNTRICDYFFPQKSIRFDIRMIIPEDSIKGDLTDIITVSFQQAYE
jgi:hypothetical protein